ncbi:hypothetical protein GDO78_009174 [Eleutherodactylus coqui]|uniref:Uncharacterized protein n=1 Tax=Eleutherodactylus coqui TaxID=57060 RepID=A0A8J6F7N3_ELECQ|nr:hypothetical protein GDO78_009174 [Eleutherodactylus coqui]
MAGPFKDRLQRLFGCWKVIKSCAGGGYFHVVSCLVFFLKSRHVKRKEWLSNLNDLGPSIQWVAEWGKGGGSRWELPFPLPKWELPLHVVTK